MLDFLVAIDSRDVSTENLPTESDMAESSGSKALERVGYRILS